MGMPTMPIRVLIAAVSWEAENERQGVIHGCHLAVAEVTDTSLDRLRIDHAQLVREHARGGAREVDRRTERGGRRRARHRSNQHGAEVEQLVRLHDNSRSRSPLLMPARTARRGQPHDLAPNHQSAGHGGVSSSSSSRAPPARRDPPDRPPASAASRRASSRSATRRRRRARASVNALRTACESLIPSARNTASAASESASSRT